MNTKNIFFLIFIIVSHELCTSQHPNTAKPSLEDMSNQVIFANMKIMESMIQFSAKQFEQQAQMFEQYRNFTSRVFRLKRDINLMRNLIGELRNDVTSLQQEYRLLRVSLVSLISKQ